MNQINNTCSGFVNVKCMTRCRIMPENGTMQHTGRGRKKIECITLVISEPLTHSTYFFQLKSKVSSKNASTDWKHLTTLCL